MSLHTDGKVPAVRSESQGGAVSDAIAESTIQVLRGN